jgi:hypothetical protein
VKVIDEADITPPDLDGSEQYVFGIVHPDRQTTVELIEQGIAITFAPASLLETFQVAVRVLETESPTAPVPGTALQRIEVILFGVDGEPLPQPSLRRPARIVMTLTHEEVQALGGSSAILSEALRGLYQVLRFETVPAPGRWVGLTTEFHSASNSFIAWTEGFSQIVLAQMPEGSEQVEPPTPAATPGFGAPEPPPATPAPTADRPTPPSAPTAGSEATPMSAATLQPSATVPPTPMPQTQVTPTPAPHGMSQEAASFPWVLLLVVIGGVAAVTLAAFAALRVRRAP